MPKILVVNTDTGDIFAFGNINNDYWQNLKSKGDPLEYLHKLIIKDMEKNQIKMINFKLILEDDFIE